jgi:hypothetical protein
MPKQSQATIRKTSNGFGVVVDGKVVSEHKTRALCAMWASRKGLYRGTTQRKRQPEIPHDLADEAVRGIPLLARLSGDSYPTFLADAKAGRYGELYQLSRGFGLRYRNFRRGMAARIISK